MSESYTIQALLSKGFCRLGGMKWFAFSEFRWRLLGTYIKSAIILKIFFISPQVVLSPFASDTSLWPKYFCRSYCWALLCFRGRPLVLLHGDGRCFACGTRERYFLSWGRYWYWLLRSIRYWLQIITWIQQTMFGLPLHSLQRGFPVLTNWQNNCWLCEDTWHFRFIAIFPHLYT